MKQMSSMAKVSLFDFYNYKLLENENMLHISVLFLLFLLLIPLKTHFTVGLGFFLLFLTEI